MPSPERPRFRSFFWPGVIIGFLLSILASCGGTAVVLGLDRIDLSDLQSSGPAWTPPAAPAFAAQVEPVETPLPDGSVTAGRFRLGQVVRNATSSQVNVRSVPGYLGKPEGDILTQIGPGVTVTILEGPQSKDNLTWWYIGVTGSGAEGWVAESTASGVQILAPVE
jgi:hypothetical protein